jgi:hypothetical protein
VPAHHGGEDERVHPPLLPGLGVADQPHLSEVDLALNTRLAVVDAHRGGLGPEPAPLDREPVQRAIGHPAALTGEQLLDLHDAQRILALPASNPHRDLLLAGEQQLPRGAVPIGARRADSGHHRTDQLIGQRLDSCDLREALGLGRSDIAASGLAVHPRPLRDLPKTGSLEPTPEHLTHLNHTDLPESHRC